MDNFVNQSVLIVSSIRWPVIAKLSLAFLRYGCKVAGCVSARPSIRVCKWTQQRSIRIVDWIRFNHSTRQLLRPSQTL